MIPNRICFVHGQGGEPPSDKWTREWIRRIDVLSGHSRVSVVSNPYDSDLVIQTSAPQIYDGHRALMPPQLAYKGNGPPVVVWDCNDLPSGLHPGMYTCLPRSRFDPSRHRAGPWSITFNEHVDAFDQGEANTLVSFQGDVQTHPVRMSVVDALARDRRSEVAQAAGPWETMLDRSSSAVGANRKQTYAQLLRRTKFIACPRGHGTGSIRFFETLKAGRVPIVISDQYVFPDGADWATCTIRLPEKEAHRVVEVAAAHEAEWSAMASCARAVWERLFGDESLLDRCAASLWATANQPVNARYYQKTFLSVIRQTQKRSFSITKRVVRNKVLTWPVART